MMIFGTAEFWVLASFLICLVIAIKLIFPKISVGIAAYQSEVATVLMEAEKKLTFAKQKLKSTHEKTDALPQVLSALLKDSKSRSRRYQKEWEKQRDYLQSYYYNMHQHHRSAIEIQMKRQLVFRVGNACAVALTHKSVESLTAKSNDKVVLKSLDELPSIW